jgi:serine/threonine protein kinase
MNSATQPDPAGPGPPAAEACPPTDQLSAFARGDLAGPAMDEVGRHLSTCAVCGSRVETLEESGGGLVGELRRFIAGDAQPPPSGWQALEFRAKAIPLGGADIRAGEEPSPRQTPTPLPSGTLPHLVRYQLLEELGRGGMGVVYAALHTRLHKRVAVKVILPEQADDPRVLTRFLREARALGALQHPNIVAATDADEADGCHFLVMELIDGLDLAELVRRRGPLPVADACEIIRQAAEGLQCAFEHGQVHRDVKPSNLMLSVGGVVKILDLGLARLLSGPVPAAAAELTHSNQAMGTADYMAPEQWADSQAVDTRADIYSLGCTLYKLLAGKPPFAELVGAPTPQKRRAHATLVPPPLATRRPDVPTALDAVLGRMLAKEPADRFATPREVVDALRPFAQGSDCERLLAEARERSSDPLSGPVATPGASAETGRQDSPTPVARREPAPARSGGWRRWLLVGAVAGLATTLAVVPFRPREEVKEPPPLPEPAWQPGVWHNLFYKEPVKLFWPTRLGNHFVGFDPWRKEVRVDAPDVAMLGLGTTEHAGYQMHLGITQNQWGGGVGLFFGWHEEIILGQVRTKVQVIELLRTSKPNPEEAFVLERKWMLLQRQGDDYRLTDTQGVDSTPVSRPTNAEECMLTIEVRKRGLVSVTWNGMPCPKLVQHQHNVQMAEADYLGPFGTFNRCSNSVFRNAQLMLFERK